MRREHDSIVIDVLDQLSRVLQRPGPFHITVLAARANLPHDRLLTYLRELEALKLVLLEPIPMITGKGREFLDCFHAWSRIQKQYGLEPRGRAPLPPTLPLPASAQPQPAAAVAVSEPPALPLPVSREP